VGLSTVGKGSRYKRCTHPALTRRSPFLALPHPAREGEQRASVKAAWRWVRVTCAAKTSAVSHKVDEDRVQPAMSTIQAHLVD
jgi:hypothetical protein